MTSRRPWGWSRSSSSASLTTCFRPSGRASSRCRYCVYFHTEAARLFGATEEEIVETALISKNTMGWSTYLNTLQFDYDKFVEEFDQIAAHVREQMAAGAPA